MQNENNGRGEADNPVELRRQLAVAQARLQSVEEELAQTRKDRDEYERAVHFLTQRDFAITREDIAEAETSGLTFEQLIESLEKAAQRDAHG